MGHWFVITQSSIALLSLWLLLSFVLFAIFFKHRNQHPLDKINPWAVLCLIYQIATTSGGVGLPMLILDGHIPCVIYLWASLTVINVAFSGMTVVVSILGRFEISENIQRLQKDPHAPHGFFLRHSRLFTTHRPLGIFAGLSLFAFHVLWGTIGALHPDPGHRCHFESPGLIDNVVILFVIGLGTVVGIIVSIIANRFRRFVHMDELKFISHFFWLAITVGITVVAFTALFLNFKMLPNSPGMLMIPLVSTAYFAIIYWLMIAPLRVYFKFYAAESTNQIVPFDSSLLDSLGIVMYHEAAREHFTKFIASEFSSGEFFVFLGWGDGCSFLFFYLTSLPFFFGPNQRISLSSGAAKSLKSSSSQATEAIQRWSMHRDELPIQSRHIEGPCHDQRLSRDNPSEARSSSSTALVPLVIHTANLSNSMGIRHRTPQLQPKRSK